MWKDKRIFSGLYWRIALAYLILIGIGFLVVNLAIIRGFGTKQVEEKQDRFKAYAIQVAQLISKDYANPDPDMKANIVYEIEKLGEDIKYLEGGQPTRILILDQKGIVEFDSYNDLSEAGFLRRNLMDEYPIIESVLSGDSVEPTALYIGKDDEDKKLVMYAYSPIIGETKSFIGATIISTSLSDVEEILSSVSAMLFRSSILIIVFVILISFGISLYITSPVKSLTQVIRQMGQGNLGQRVKVRGGGEFRELGDAFNTMSEKLENLDRARNEFVSNASHELKTPLSAIKILAESLLYMGEEVPEIYIEFLNDINLEIDRLNAIITDLLSLVSMDTKGELMDLEPVNLSLLTEITTKSLLVLADSKDIKLNINIEDEIIILGNRARLQQVISNLVDNAIKYTPTEGQVTIDVYEEKGEANIRVKDTGIGIPEEDIPHLFDRFFRVDKARSRYTGGTGLGLSIANSIILMYEGRMSVESKENEGSNFLVSFPIYEE